MLKKCLLQTLALVLVSTSTSGCILFAAGAGAEAGYVASQDHKSTGQTIDDQLIVSSIKTRMLADSKVSAMNINVDCDKGVVTLRGFAKDQEELDRALEIANKVSGVQEVISKLTIQD